MESMESVEGGGERGEGLLSAESLSSKSERTVEVDGEEVAGEDLAEGEGSPRTPLGKCMNNAGDEKQQAEEAGPEVVSRSGNDDEAEGDGTHEAPQQPLGWKRTQDLLYKAQGIPRDMPHTVEPVRRSRGGTPACVVDRREHPELVTQARGKPDWRGAAGRDAPRKDPSSRLFREVYPVCLRCKKPSSLAAPIYKPGFCEDCTILHVKRKRLLRPTEEELAPGVAVQAQTTIYFREDNAVVEEGAIGRVVHVPGFTPDSICQVYFDGKAFDVYEGQVRPLQVDDGGVPTTSPDSTLEVVCKNRPAGCTWSGPLHALLQHSKGCKATTGSPSRSPAVPRRSSGRHSPAESRHSTQYSTRQRDSPPPRSPPRRISYAERPEYSPVSDRGSVKSTRSEQYTPTTYMKYLRHRS